jgi:integrase/recombinase XerC/integrase/recombinase XerD
MKNDAMAHDASPGLPPRRFERRGARAFHRVLLEYGEVRADPHALLEDHEVSQLLDRIPATTPLELRDRAMFELACARGYGAAELVRLDLGTFDLDPSDPALRAVARYLQHGRDALAGEAGVPALFVSKTGRRLSTSDARRRLRVWARQAALSGQRSKSTTQGYTRVESARLRAAYERSHPRA